MSEKFLSCFSITKKTYKEEFYGKATLPYFLLLVLLLFKRNKEQIPCKV
jgi:hypothetical protein